MGAPVNKIRLAVISTHPIQYYAPLYREIFSRPDITGEVLFAGRHGTESSSFDPEFAQTFKWDIDLTGGYPHKFLDVHARFRKPSAEAVRWYTSVGRELTKTRYDVVLIPGYRPLFELHALTASFHAGLPVMIRPEGFDRHAGTFHVKNQLRELYLKQIYRRVAAYLAIGSRSRQHFLHHSGDAERVTASPYAVDNERFAADFNSRQRERASLRANEGIRGEDLAVIFSGKMIARKRPMTLVQAVARSRSKPRIHIIWAGSGPLLDAVKTACAAEGLRASFPGFVNQSDIGRYYTMADLHVLPSAEETWGLVVNETMNYWLPQIVTEGVASGDDLVTGKNTGFIVGIDDATAMAEKIDFFVQRPDARDDMGRASRQVISRHGIKEAADGIVAAAHKVTRR